MISILVEMSHNQLAKWFDQSEVLEGAILSALQGKKLQALSSPWLLTQLIEYKDCLLVRTLVDKILVVSKHAEFSNKSEDYPLCLYLCYLLRTIFSMHISNMEHLPSL